LLIGLLAAIMVWYLMIDIIYNPTFKVVFLKINAGLVNFPANHLVMISKITSLTIIIVIT